MKLSSAALGLVLLLASGPSAGADRVAHFLDQLEAAGFKVRLQAAYILGTLKDRRAVPGLAKALSDVHYAVRAAAAAALGMIGEPVAAEAVMAATTDEEAWVRAEAIRALGKLKAQGALSRVEAALDDSDWKVRLEAARALGRLGDKRAVLPLARLIEAGDVESEELIDEARRALLRLKPVIDLFEVIGLLKGASDKRARARAAVLLGTLKDPRAVPALIEALADRESYVRGQIARALAKVGDARALGPLEEALAREVDPRVKSITELSIAELKRGRRP